MAHLPQIPKGLIPANRLSKKQQKEFNRQAAFIREKLLPILAKNAKNVKDAQNIVQSVLVGMDYKFNRMVKEYQDSLSGKPMGEMNLQAEMTDDPKLRVKYTGEREIVDAIMSETIGTARGLVQGLEKLLEGAVTKEMLKKEFKELNIEV